MDTQRQLTMVINLDKCIGCQTCTASCRTHRTQRPGCEMLYYMWCETRPGKGFPKDWMAMERKTPNWVEDYGGTWTFNWEDVYASEAGGEYLRPLAKEDGKPVKWGPVWDEDEGGGEWPNGHFFYMPRLCNHCSEPGCVDSCEKHCARHDIPVAMSKRESDGVVVIDEEKCDGCGHCVATCPYKIPMPNATAGTYEMCDFCLPRVEKDHAPVCAKSCPARAMYFGYLDDEDSYVSKLVNEYGVALPLRPDFGTGPNVYYVPPFVRPAKLEADHRPTDESDIPIDLLRSYFGPDVEDALATLREHRAKAERGELSELMDLLIIYKWADAFAPFEVTAPQNPNP
jgi:complex iron-sulfur molybdoenzyme family reductase subunit beta